MALNDENQVYLGDDHQNFRQRLNDLRISDQLVDVCLKVTESEKVFNAHRVILAASSDYFTSSMPLMISVKGVKEKDLQDILAYIYLGEVMVPRERLQSFLEAAKLLKIHNLQDTHIEENVVQEEHFLPMEVANKQEHPDVGLTLEFEIENIKVEPGLDLDWSSNNNVIKPPSNLEELGHVIKNQPEVVLQRLPCLDVMAKSKKQSKNNSSRTYVCNSCNKSFYKSTSLARHDCTDDRKRPYECQYCSQKFCRLHHKKDHELIHLGIKPYKCRFCHKSFREKSKAKKHQLTVHVGIKVKKKSKS